MGPAEDLVIRCLIVDDDWSLGQALKELIATTHTVVEVFSDGQKALAYLREHPVDVVITDLMMPGVNGLDVLSRAKQENPAAMVIIITGHGTLESAIEAVRKGAYDYIRKPFKLDEIKIAFNNAVEKIRLVQKNQDLVEKLKKTCDEFVAFKKACECRESDKQSGSRTQTNARLNFFSTTVPNLDFNRRADDGREQLFKRLDQITGMKRQGLLTSKEFETLKRHLIDDLEPSRIDRSGGGPGNAHGRTD
ncbi:MAG: response regulator [Deltaproteobacteria bacterium]|nr:response regulator [Deltaproteobacteria bacterium]